MTTTEKRSTTEPSSTPQHQLPQPQREHEWLQRLVGDWTYETFLEMEPGKPRTRFAGTESVRPLGKLWVVAEGKGEMPGGGEAVTLLTLGFDPERQRFVGTWVGSMMSNMFVYEGELDPEGKSLILHTEGPNMMEPGSSARFRETITLESDGERLFSSHMLEDDGGEVEMMTARYRRSGRGKH
jgi:hypothetical protein